EVDSHSSPPGTVRDPRPLDGVMRLTKLHGSLDWRWDPDNRRVLRIPLPFGAASTGAAADLLIFPNAAKDVETTFHPYADLSRDFSAALCRPHTALVTYGYSFGDDHLNRVIKDMLTIPSTHLLIISWDDASGRIARFAQDHRRLGQISLMIGPSMASLPALVGRWLPWPSAEFLLQRRAQIYRDRSTGPTGGGQEPDDSSANVSPAAPTPEDD
ncbi:MAG TPA: SIR2 family protein, partial [Baekduia sp.]|nr:SIR2 family protein [Baekduia sp.]